VIPTNRPPVLNQLTPQLQNATSPAGALVSVLAFPTDPDSDPLTVTFAGPLGSSTVTQVTNGFAGTQLAFPIGTNTLTVTVDDGNGGVVAGSPQVTVFGSIVSTPGTVEVTPQATFNTSFSNWARLHPLYEPTVRVKLEGVFGPGVVTLNIRSDVANPPVP